MSSVTSIDLTEWNTFAEQLEALLLDDQQQIVAKATEASAIELDRIARDALPPKPRKQTQAQHWTAKQMRWWWWTMRQKALGRSRALPGWTAKYVQRNGRMELVIGGAYRRTGTLVKSLAYRVTSGTRGDQVYATAQYGTNRPYARYVIDADRQAQYHQNNWTPLQTLLSANAERIARAGIDTIDRELDRRIN